MTIYKDRSLICFYFYNTHGAGDKFTHVDVACGLFATQAQARVKINAGADTIENSWYGATSASLQLYNGVQITEQAALDTYVWALITPTQLHNWRISVYSISNADSSEGEPNTGTASWANGGLDDVRWIDLGNDVTAKAAVLTALQGVQDASHNECVVCISWKDDTNNFDSMAGETGNATFQWRWCDATDTLQIRLANGTWYTISSSVLTFQAALDILAAFYPTNAYDAAYQTDADGCQIVIVKYNPSGTPGTITFSQGFQDLIEDNGTWIAPMRMGVDFSKWVS